MSRITKKEHAVIAHILKFVNLYAEVNMRVMHKNDKKFKRYETIYKKINELKNKLDDEFTENLTKDDIVGIIKSPYYGWNDEKSLSEYNLMEMYEVIKDDSKTN